MKRRKLIATAMKENLGGHNGNRKYQERKLSIYTQENLKMSTSIFLTFLEGVYCRATVFTQLIHSRGNFWESLVQTPAQGRLSHHVRPQIPTKFCHKQSSVCEAEPRWGRWKPKLLLLTSLCVRLVKKQTQKQI